MTHLSDPRFHTGVDLPLTDKILKQIIASIWRFRVPKSPGEYEELVEVWCAALNMSPSTYPPAIYLEAVASFLSEATHDTNPPMPGDILTHCKKVMDRIAKDPERGPKMRAWQEARREARTRMLSGEDNQ